MLAELQRDMSGWLRDGAPEAVERFGEQAAPGLRIYQNNYRAQLVTCLESSFPQTRAWIGDEAFHQAIVTHVTRVPPSSWTLDAYPRDFPTTLALIYPADAEIVELATLELALDEAFVGPDADAVLADALGEVDWDRARLTFVPTLDLRPLITNAPAIWAALRDDEPPPAAELLPERGTLLVWRQAQTSRFRAIDMLEQQAIMLARSGMRFAALCAALVDLRGDAVGVGLAGGYLGQWLGEGLVSEITDGDDDA